MMYATIQKWGNSQGIRIPKSFLESFGLCENDKVDLVEKEEGIVIKKIAQNKHKTIEERLEDFYKLPIEQIRIDEQLDEMSWGNAAGEEIW